MSKIDSTTHKLFYFQKKFPYLHWTQLLGLRCLTPLSKIFQLYRGASSTPVHARIQTHNFNGDMH